MQVGDKMPVFELLNERNMLIRMSPKDGKKRMFFFYPKSGTKICTKQACGFRDKFDELSRFGYEVIGISRDSPLSQAAFIEKNRLNYMLLSDTGGKVSRKFGASRFLGLVPWRKTVLVNEKGRIIFEYEDMLKGEEHIKKVIQFLKNKL